MKILTKLAALDAEIAKTQKTLMQDKFLTASQANSLRGNLAAMRKEYKALVRRINNRGFGGVQINL